LLYGVGSFVVALIIVVLKVKQGHAEKEAPLRPTLGICSVLL
jgi:hypothetical protein